MDERRRNDIRDLGGKLSQAESVPEWVAHRGQTPGTRRRWKKRQARGAVDAHAMHGEDAPVVAVGERSRRVARTAAAALGAILFGLLLLEIGLRVGAPLLERMVRPIGSMMQPTGREDPP